MGQLSVAYLSIDKIALEGALKTHHEIVKNRARIVNQQDNLNPCYHSN